MGMSEKYRNNTNKYNNNNFDSPWNSSRTDGGKNNPTLQDAVPTNSYSNKNKL